MSDSQLRYANFDHAGWLESEVGKSLGRPLTPFERRCARIVGIVGGGIYNCSINWSKAQFSRSGAHPSLQVMWRVGSLSTFDWRDLTLLVFLCHEARIRCAIASKGPGIFALHFSERSAAGDVALPHPNLDEAIAEFRAQLRPEHPLVYREDPQTTLGDAA